MIKILIGGSPCTYWSIAQKNGRETEPSGLGWELFRNYLIAKEVFQPDIFLYENNKSAARAIKDRVKHELGVWDGTLLMDDSGARYIEINSALVSAQNRQRFYVHNCGEVGQPKDRGILLKDILETTIAEPLNVTLDGKSQTIKAQYQNTSTVNICCYKSTYGATGVAEPIRIPPYGNTDKARPLEALYANHAGTGEGSLEKRLFSDNPNKQHNDLIAEPIRVGAVPIGETLSEEYYKGGCDGGIIGMIENPSNYRNGKQPPQQYRVYSCEGKAVCVDQDQRKHYIMPSNGKTYPIYEVKDGLITIKGKLYPIKLADGYYIIRKLTVTECERLQTLPDGYISKSGVSASQCYKGLGNGWTAEVIIHILSHALKNISRDKEIVVLSMYDGIGTGRYCLDKMGFTNVIYFAYEIDKYAIQIAQHNYPDIIQCGDAFAVRDYILDISAPIMEIIRSARMENAEQYISE